MIDSFFIRTPLDQPNPVSFSSPLQSLATATIFSLALRYPNAAGNTVKERVTNTTIYLAGWTCLTLSLQFIPVTRLVHSFLSPKVDTTVAFLDLPIAIFYRDSLFEFKNRILEEAKNYSPEPYTAQKKSKAATAEKILLGTLTLCAAPILLKKALPTLSNNAKAVHFVASCFFSYGILYPFIKPFIFLVFRTLQPGLSNRIADLRDFYDDVGTLSVEEKKERVAAISYGIQMHRKEVEEESYKKGLDGDWIDYPYVPLESKTYIAVALGITGIFHKLYPFTQPKLLLTNQALTLSQKASSFILNDFVLPQFSGSLHRVVSAIFNT